MSEGALPAPAPLPLSVELKTSKLTNGQVMCVAVVRRQPENQHGNHSVNR